MANPEWESLRNDDPDDFKKAVEIEREVRAIDPHFYLHESCIPLDMADLKAPEKSAKRGGCSSGMCY